VRAGGAASEFETEDAVTEWDIFISYSRRDKEWVDGVLCRELLRRYVGGRTPRLFLDTGPDGVQPGQPWFLALAEGVERSRFFVAVYSAHFFTSAICRREMDWAMSLHADDDRLIPLRIDPSAKVPFAYAPINFLPTERADWVEQLCDRLELRGHRDRPGLRFRTAVTDVRIDHTLPEQQVELLRHAPGAAEEEVTLDTAPRPGLLRGTLTAHTARGVATFRDLSIAMPCTDLRLVASYRGGDPVHSGPFSVRGAGSGRVRDRGPAPAAWLLADSRTLSVLRDGALTVAESSVPFDDVPKQHTRWGDRIAIAGWTGLVAVAGGGTAGAYRLGEGLAVPGALCPVEERLYVGMWNGQVWSLGRGLEPEPVLRHAAGVQAMAAVDDQLMIVGFDGAVTWYAAGGTPAGREAHRLEPTVWGLLVRPDCVVVAGAERVHRLDLAGDTVISLRLMEGEAAGAVVADEQIAVYDGYGYGLRVDSELEVRGAFRVPAGGRPVDIDRCGTVLLAEDPDGSSALLVGDRVTYVSRRGAMAIAPDGAQVVLLGPDGTSTFPPDDPPAA
jgi:hypothetical protein